MTDAQNPDDKPAIKPANPRKVAVDILGDVLQRKRQMDMALAHHPDMERLSQRDRNFVRLLVSTVLRRKGQLDRVLQRHLRQIPPAPVMNALRLGAAQILILKTPPHAAVGETVNLVKSLGKYRGLSGLSNAVMRKVVDSGPSDMAATAPKENLPGWIRASWEAAYGRTNMQLMARQLADIPPIDISVKSDPQLWAERLGGQALLGNTVRLGGSAPLTELPGYDSGEWWVQDAAASLPVQLLGDVSGLEVLDVCAAPGGKTLQLAAGGARVTALDVSEGRLARLADNLDRTHLTATLEIADIFDWQPPDGRLYDIVVLDAPCTASGTFRRHPDVLYTKSENLVSKLAKIQARMLRHVAQMVKPGGRILYCTCSLQPREGEDIISQFLTDHSEFTLQTDGLAEFADLTYARPDAASANGHFRLLPHALRETGGMDGFYAAILQNSKKLDRK